MAHEPRQRPPPSGAGGVRAARDLTNVSSRTTLPEIETANEAFVSQEKITLSFGRFPRASRFSGPKKRCREAITAGSTGGAAAAGSANETATCITRIAFILCMGSSGTTAL
jgi:hypothetical protein